MKRKKRIESILLEKFSKWKTEVNDISILHKGHNNFEGYGETHLSITLKTNKKNIESTLEIHKKINKLLVDEFNSGHHALQIKIINLFSLFLILKFVFLNVIKLYN